MPKKKNPRKKEEKVKKKVFGWVMKLIRLFEYLSNSEVEKILS